MSLSSSGPGLPAIEHLNSSAFMRLGLPFSEIVRVGEMLHLSGQMATLPGTLTVAAGGIRAEAEQALQNIEAALDCIVKCTVMLADLADGQEFNEVDQRFFTPPYPARSAFGASGLALGGRVEIEALAVARLRRAGFRLLGRTASSEFGINASVEPSWAEPTRNPWNLERERSSRTRRVCAFFQR